MFLLLFLLVAVLPVSTEGGEIIGGTTAPDHSLPYMALINSYEKKPNSFRCGSFLVKNDILMTAAHCNGSNITVTLGVHVITKLNVREPIRVLNAISQEKYDKDQKINDIMLLKLERKVQLSKNVDTINLTKRAASHPGKKRTKEQPVSNQSPLEEEDPGAASQDPQKKRTQEQPVTLRGRGPRSTQTPSEQETSPAPSSKAEMGRRQCKSTYNNIKNKTSPESSPPPTPRPEHCNVDKAEENDLKNSLMKMIEEALEGKMKNAIKEIEEKTNKKLEEINKEIEEKNKK
ncbi:hypothetical protein STEG23_007608 [Scotinomys teguina]